jgi:hypothetical protein
MGQPVAVIEKQTRTPGLLRFEANRFLTGMGHEHFRSIEEATGDRPSALLARRLFETGHVEAVHVYGNMITVDVRKGFMGEDLREIVENLYIYYRPGFVPPPLVMPAEPEPSAAAAPAVGGEGDDAAPALSEAAKKVPAHLLERSRAAKARAAAKAAG